MRSYSLLVDLRWPSERIDKVTINSSFVYTVKLSLEVPEIRLTKRPCLSQGELFELVPDGEKFVIGVLESGRYASLPVYVLVKIIEVMNSTNFCFINVTQSKLRRSRVPISVLASGAASGCTVASCILSTISASFSSVVPSVSYARMPYSFSSSSSLLSSSEYSSTSSCGN
jgi:hypothetical protein